MWRGSCKEHSQSQSQNHYRLVVLGGGAVGKTALLKRFLNDEFVEKHRETVEDLHTKTFDVNGHLIQAHILDTAGNMSFPAMRRLSIGNANAFLLVYSLMSKESFQNMKEIFNEIKTIREAADQNEFRSLPIVIAANKSDCPVDEWEITRLQIDEFMLNETMDCHAAHVETSAKTAYNVRTVFETFVRLSPILADRLLITNTPGQMNGTPTPGRTRLNSGPTSPLRRKQKPAPTLRRFSLQALTLGSNSMNCANATVDSGSTSPSASPPMGGDFKQGSPSSALNSNARRSSNVRPFPRRQSKTKSHEDLDIPECFVQ